MFLANSSLQFPQQDSFPTREPKLWKNPRHPKPPVTKPLFPIFRFFPFFLALTVARSAFSVFSAVFAVCSCVLHHARGWSACSAYFLWIEFEGNWDDRGCVCVHTKSVEASDCSKSFEKSLKTEFSRLFGLSSRLFFQTFVPEGPRTFFEIFGVWAWGLLLPGRGNTL